MVLEILKTEPQATVRLNGIKSLKPFELIAEWAIMQWHRVGAAGAGLDQEGTTPSTPWSHWLLGESDI